MIPNRARSIISIYIFNKYYIFELYQYQAYHAREGNKTLRHEDKIEKSFRMETTMKPYEFDLIFSNAALHWVKDHRRLLKNVYTTLKTGGILLWDFGSDGNCANFLAVMQNIMTTADYADFFKDFETPWFMPAKDRYEALIADVGFSDHDIAEMNRDRYFPSSDALIKWIDQPCIVPFIGRIPAGQKEAFRGEVIAAMLKRTLQPDGTCFETFRRLQVYAQK